MNDGSDREREKEGRSQRERERGNVVLIELSAWQHWAFRGIRNLVAACSQEGLVNMAYMQTLGRAMLPSAQAKGRELVLAQHTDLATGFSCTSFDADGNL